MVAHGIPRTRGRVHPRPRLLRRLDALLPVMIIRGLFGTGKTTLAASWSHARHRAGDHVVWFVAGPTPGATIAADVAAQLVSDDQTPLIIVIDDAHLLSDDDALAHLCDLTARHHRLHLVLCTRLPHPIQQHANERGLAWAELTARDLDVRRGELREIAQVWGHDIDEDREAELLRSTGGWIAPARHALDETDPGHDPTGQLAAERYVRDEVLSYLVGRELPVAVLAVTVPEEVTVDLVRAVTLAVGQPGHAADESTESVLPDFERQGLLDPVPTASGARRWRMPVLLRRVLFGLLTEAHPRWVARTHGVIARVLARDPDPRRAGHVIRHARAAADWDLLGRAWQLHGLWLAVMHPEDMLEAYDAIPAPVLSRHAALATAAAVLTALRKHSDARGRVTLMRNYANAGWTPGADVRPSEAASHSMEVIALIIADRLGGEPEQALQRARDHREWLAVRGEDQPSAITTAWFELQWGLSAHAVGEVGEALRRLLDALQSARGAGANFLAAAASSQLGLITALEGQTGQAVKCLSIHQNIETASQWLHETITPAADIAAAMLSLDRLDPSAIQLLDDVGDGSDSVEEWAALTWVRTQHALLMGDPLSKLADVNHIAQLHQGLMGQGSWDQSALDRALADLLLAVGEFNRASGYLDVATGQDRLLAVPRARLALITGDPQQARHIALDYVWREQVTLRDRADLFMIEAVAALGVGDEAAAVAAFGRGHSVASRMDSLIPYVNIPRDALERLLVLGGIELPHGALESIRAVREVFPRCGELVRLTPREMAVLQSMAGNETLADVAAELTVSLNTVKKQSASIYAKLGVNDRPSALVEAYRLGLLSERAV